MFRSKAFTIFTHVLCWFLFFSLPLLFLSQQSNSEQLIGILRTPEYWIFYGYFIFLFYFHAHVLLPYLFLRKKYILYIGMLILLFTAVYYLKPFHNLIESGKRTSTESWDFKPPPGKPIPSSGNRELPPFPNNTDRPPPRDQAEHFDILSTFLFIMIVALSMAVEITRQWRTTQQRAQQAETDKAVAELSFLKAQINPHFLFNILNNIYSLAVTQNQNTAGAILKLSNIMRYLTDEVKADFVSLENEVAYIQDYIDLQQLRLSKKVKLDFIVDGNLENKKIAPLILITFIENVFKYGISNHQEANIIIKLKAEEHQLVFMCQNPIIQTENSFERTGIGLTNTKDRLQFLYPGQHNLTISTEKNIFTVILILTI